MHNKTRRYILDFFILVIFFLIIFGIEISYRFDNIANLDEGIYLTVSGSISEGNILYKDVYESHPPLFFFINAIFVKLVGRDIFLIRLFVILISAMSSLLIYKITYHIIRDNRVSITSGFTFAIFSSLPVYEGFIVMTEPYLVLFELLTIFLLLNAISKKDNILFFISGISIPLNILIRQTSGLFLLFIFIFIIIEVIRKNVRGRNLVTILLGVAISFILFGLYFIINGALKDAIYWIVVEPLTNVNTTGKIDPKLKLEWFTDIIMTSLPLLVLTIYFSLKNRKIDLLLSILLIFTAILYLVNVKTSLVPGFHHEYREGLIILSIISPIGFYSLLNDIKINHNKVTIVFSMILILSIFIFSEKLYDQFSYFRNYESRDMYFINNISDNLKECKSDNIYVFETKWPKISLEIYFVTGKYPEIKRYFYFPPFIDRNDSKRLIQNLDNTDCVTVIGEKPPFEEAKNIYDFISAHYIPVKHLGNYTSYKWLPDQPVTIYRKIDSFNSSNFVDVLDLDIKDVPITSPHNVNVIVKYDDNIVLDYEFAEQSAEQSGKWFGLLFKNNESLDLDNKDILLKMDIYSTNENDTLQIDLVDKEGNWKRFETMLLHTNVTNYFISLNENNFGVGIDYKNIERIHISIENSKNDDPIHGRIIIKDLKLIKFIK